MDYDPEQVHHYHTRVKRWTLGEQDLDADEEPEVYIRFKAQKRDFKLRLKRDTSTFSQNLQFVGDGADPGATDFTHIYAGHVEGVANSHAFGSIRDGVFDGKIITPGETFYVERAHKYALPSTNKSLHSVIYSERDVHDPYHHHRTGKIT